MSHFEWKLPFFNQMEKSFNQLISSFKNPERFFEDRGGVKRNKLGESRGREIAARRRDRKMWQLIIFANSKKSSSHFFVFFRSSTSKKNIFRFLKTYISTTRGSNGVREHGHAEWARRKTGQTVSGKRINIDKIISNIFEKHSKNSIFGLNFWILASGVKCFTRHICSRNY